MGNFMCILKSLKKEFNDDYEIKDLEENRTGLIIFSKAKFTETEKKKLFTQKEKCFFKNSITKEPHSRYLYIEKIEEHKKGGIFQKREGLITFVMLNPSYTNEICSDLTTSKVRKRASILRKSVDSGYKYFAIINLFSYRHPKPQKLKEILSKEISTNYEPKEDSVFIEKFLCKIKKYKDFVIAFGSTSIYNYEKNKLLKLLKDKNLQTFYSDGKPYHTNCGKKVYDENKQLHLYPLKYDGG